MELTAIQGNLLKTEDIRNWNNAQFQGYFECIDCFYEAEGKLLVNKETIQKITDLSEVNSIAKELLLRIDRPLDDKFDKRKYQMRMLPMLQAFKRAVTLYPELLTPMQVTTQIKKLQYDWMHNIYKENGLPKTEEDKPKEVPKGLAVLQAKPIDAPYRLNEAMNKVADLYYAIAESITDEDIATLNTKDKINALNKLSYAHSIGKKQGKVTFNFNKITKASSTDDIEAALLQNDDEEDE